MRKLIILAIAVVIIFAHVAIAFAFQIQERHDRTMARELCTPSFVAELEEFAKTLREQRDTEPKNLQEMCAVLDTIDSVITRSVEMAGIRAPMVAREFDERVKKLGRSFGLFGKVDLRYIRFACHQTAADLALVITTKLGFVLHERQRCMGT